MVLRTAKTRGPMSATDQETVRISCRDDVAIFIHRVIGRPYPLSYLNTPLLLFIKSYQNSIFFTLR